MYTTLKTNNKCFTAACTTNEKMFTNKRFSGALVADETKHQNSSHKTLNSF